MSRELKADHNQGLRESGKLPILHTSAGTTNTVLRPIARPLVPHARMNDGGETAPCTTPLDDAWYARVASEKNQRQSRVVPHPVQFALDRAANVCSPGSESSACARQRV